MSRVEVLVACMHQADDKLYREMNLQTDAVLANQCDQYGYVEYSEPNGSKAKLVSSADRGVGKNRNKALLHASGEYLLCADQDMIYEDNYATIVEEAFKACPKADLIAFNLTYLNRFTPGRKAGKKFKRIHVWNSMRYGAARIAIRRFVRWRGEVFFGRRFSVHSRSPTNGAEALLLPCYSCNGKARGILLVLWL